MDGLIELLPTVLPLCCASHGAIRCTAQIITHRLLRLVLSAPSAPDSATHLHAVLRFLDTDRDCAKVRRRQAAHLNLLRAENLCTVRGVMSSGPTVEGAKGADCVPRTVMEAIQATLTEIHLELEAEEVRSSTHMTASPMPKTNQQVAAGRAHLLGITLRPMACGDKADDAAPWDTSIVQRKPEPWNTLALTLSEAVRWERTNAVGRMRQRLIVCASLVDKVSSL